MSKKIGLSLSGGSGLPISKFLICPRWFKYIKDGFRKRYYKPALAEGLIFHSYAEKSLKRDIFRKEGNDVVEIDPKEAGEVLKSGKWIDKRRKKEIMWDTEGEDADKIKDGAERIPGMLEKFLVKKKEFGEVLEVEKKIEIEELIRPVGDPSKKEIEGAGRLLDNGVYFSGRSDFVTEDNTIHDLKTSKSEWKQEEADDQQQASLYGYITSVMTYNPVKEFVYHIFTKHKRGCRYQEIRTKRSTEDYMSTYENLLSVGLRVLDCEENGEYPKEGSMRTNCRDRYFRRCPFHVLCFPEKYSEDEQKKELESIIKD